MQIYINFIVIYWHRNLIYSLLSTRNHEAKLKFVFLQGMQNIFLNVISAAYNLYFERLLSLETFVSEELLGVKNISGQGDKSAVSSNMPWVPTEFSLILLSKLPCGLVHFGYSYATVFVNRLAKEAELCIKRWWIFVTNLIVNSTHIKSLFRSNNIYVGNFCLKFYGEMLPKFHFFFWISIILRSCLRDFICDFQPYFKAMLAKIDL